MDKSIGKSERMIRINLSRQQLRLCEGERILFEASISSATNGPGEIINSECTPRGWHQIRAKIGAGCASNTVFVGRRPTGEIYSEEMAKQFPGRDWILTRILWLSGLESGLNRSGDVDTMRRYIYIHGSPDNVVMGVAGSHGCIRMRNCEIETLFDMVSSGTRVLIEA